MTRELLKHDKEWIVGQGATDDEWKKHKKISTAELVHDPEQAYKFLISAIVPRPVGFIVTSDKDGKINAAPYSAFNFVSTNPPVFVIGVSPSALRGGEKKDTLANALLTGELTINTVSENFIDAANYTAINTPEGVDELELVGLHTSPSKLVKVPHIAESPFSIEAKVISTHTWKSQSNGETTGTLIIAEGIHSWVREDILNDEKSALDITKYKPVGRLAGLDYHTFKDRGYPLNRPLWEEEKHA